MMFRIWISALVFASSLCFGQVFGQQKDSSKEHDHGHEHVSHGPHDGELLEVGKEEFHIELVIDEKKKLVVIYLLDKAAKSYVEIDAPFVPVNLLIAGKPMQIKLKSMPQEEDKKGLSSCFGAVSPELLDALHAPKSNPRIALKLQNKSYTVKITHDHSNHAHAATPSTGTAKKR